MIPGLKTQGFWAAPPGCGVEFVPDPRLSWVEALEANFEAIRDEVLALRDAVNPDGGLDGFQQYRTPNWNATPGDGAVSGRPRPLMVAWCACAVFGRLCLCGRVCLYVPACVCVCV